MVIEGKYGVVYTPEGLASFVARLIQVEASELGIAPSLALDPSCGEGSLLSALRGLLPSDVVLVGVDVDASAAKATQSILGHRGTAITNDFILPVEGEDSSGYWREALGEPDIVIANPPWSSERIFPADELTAAGFDAPLGQYDSYTLFMDLSLRLVKDGGLCAFILPDSVFSATAEPVRRKLVANTSIRCIARLGEKFFPGVNRATAVLLVRKEKPTPDSKVKCFRLSPGRRKSVFGGEADLYQVYLEDRHEVLQSGFVSDPYCRFSVDVQASETGLLRKIESDQIDWNSTFVFSRGVEVSKSGLVAKCPHCGKAQGFKKAHEQSGEKTCVHCGSDMPVTGENTMRLFGSSEESGSIRTVVGEDVGRYVVSEGSFLVLGVPGIDYKDPECFSAEKILVRKTGLGIKAALDKGGVMTTQTVYSCRYVDPENAFPMEYYLALLNSRLVYYYYLKMYGETEWKSHPYITKKILFSLPLKKPSSKNAELCAEIALLCAELMQCHSREKDLALEGLVFELYGITHEERERIRQTMSALPELSAIAEMKF